MAVFAVIHDARVTSTADARSLELSDQVWRTIEEVKPVLKGRETKVAHADPLKHLLESVQYMCMSLTFVTR